MLWRLFLSVTFSMFVASGVVSPAQAGFIDFPMVKIQALDKSTARTVTLEANVGSTIEYGSIFIKLQACREAEPLDKPESAAFLQVWEVPLNSKKSEWVFSGWMFSSSPALSAMDHPVYDVWVLDCIDKNQQNFEAQQAQSGAQIADQDNLAEPVVETIIHNSEGEGDDASSPRIVMDDGMEGVISAEDAEIGADDPLADIVINPLLDEEEDNIIIQYE